MIPPKRRDVVNADTQRWSPPAGMSPYLPASTILNPLRRPPSAKRHLLRWRADLLSIPQAPAAGFWVDKWPPQSLILGVATANSRIVGYALPRVTCVVWAAPEASR